MSLKAKIEAVIYAAEEPVTLLQLAGLLGQEAQVELDRRAAAQQTLALQADSEAELSESASPETLNEETLGSSPSPNPDPDPADTVFPSQPEQSEPQPLNPEPFNPDPVAPSTPEAVVPPAPDSGSDAPSDQSPSPPLPDPDIKQLARDTRAREARLRDFFRDLLDDLVRDYATSDRGLEIREVAGGYRLATKPEYHDAVRGFVKSLKPPLKLSLQALETLAVVAYKQPVTAPEISEIRGVDSGGVLGSLLARKLVTTAGRKQVIGRPILYKTTKDFLLRFGLKDINELPSIEEFEKMAGELADQDSLQEHIPMPDATRNISVEDAASDSPGATVTEANLEAERESIEPQADGDSTPLDNAMADDVQIDGRLSGLPPRYDANLETGAEVDSPAEDAEIQSQIGSSR